MFLLPRCHYRVASIFFLIPVHPVHKNTKSQHIPVFPTSVRVEWTWLLNFENSIWKNWKIPALGRKNLLSNFLLHFQIPKDITVTYPSTLLKMFFSQYIFYYIIFSQISLNIKIFAQSWQCHFFILLTLTSFKISKKLRTAFEILKQTDRQNNKGNYYQLQSVNAGSKNRFLHFSWKWQLF